MRYKGFDCITDDSDWQVLYGTLIGTLSAS